MKGDTATLDYSSCEIIKGCTAILLSRVAEPKS